LSAEKRAGNDEKPQLNTKTKPNSSMESANIGFVLAKRLFRVGLSSAIGSVKAAMGDGRMAWEYTLLAYTGQGIPADRR
jgi:hypothetical protein